MPETSASPEVFLPDLHSGTRAEERDPAEASLLRVEIPFERAPGVLRNLMPNFQLTGTARKLWQRHREHPRFAGISDCYLTFRELLANLLLSCPQCGADFQLHCRMDFHDPQLTLEEDSWWLSDRSSCPRCGGSRIRIKVLETRMLFSSNDAFDISVLGLGMSLASVAIWAFWWGPLAAVDGLKWLVLLVATLIAGSAVVLWILRTHFRRRVLKGAKKTVPSDGLSPPAVAGAGDRSVLAIAQELDRGRVSA